ncbi:acyl carrier protein [Reyranella sp.]|uniref:acyl carrier protein n=1 Tax=Reyranella sp. TaxID=1929291 RepID=UPI003D0DB3DC
MNDIEQRISQIITTHFGVEQDKIVPTADFRSDMSADSLDLIDLTLSVEDAFGIEIADKVAEEIHTVGDLIAYIRGQQTQLRAA